MAKNKYQGRGNMNYNRQSGGYQKNLYRQKMNAENIKAPKTLDPKKLRWYAIGIGVAWLAIAILLVVKLKWIGLLIGLAIGLAVVGGIYLFLQYKQKQMITYYKKIGMTEDLYINELKRRGTPKKQLDQYRKIWRKIKVD